MSIVIGDTHTEITIKPNTRKLDLDEVMGSIKPGALANMSNYCSIKWGIHQTQRIEPGVFSHLSKLSLMLDESYKHTIEDVLHSDAEPYIHDSNRELVPVGRCFWLWKREGAFKFSPEEKVKWTIISGPKTDMQFGFVKSFGPNSVQIVKLEWKPDPEPTPVVKLVGKPVAGILSLFSLSSRLDTVLKRLDTIDARLDRVEANQKPLVQPALPITQPKVVMRLKATDRVGMGVIPINVTHLDCDNINYDELKPGVIPDSVTHLYVMKFTKKSRIPASVKHLFVYYMDGSVDIPETVEHVYVHVNCEEDAPARPHYLFYISLRGIPDNYIHKAKYDFGEQTIIRPFNHSLAIVKRTAKVQSS